MRIVKIPKRSGGYRTVVCPSKKIKNLLRKQIPALTELCLALDVDEVMHGFLPGRSPVTNAKRHIGYKWTVSFDLSDFFDHVTATHLLAATLRGGWSSYLYPDGPSGRAAQGLPTSPVIANIAASSLDKALSGRAEAYTRYADDMTFSTNDRDVVDQLIREVPGVCSSLRLPVNKRKTKIQNSTSGRREVTGVMVGEDSLYIPRAIKRRIRAAQNQSNVPQERGLREWAKLKMPCPHNSCWISGMEKLYEVTE